MTTPTQAQIEALKIGQTACLVALALEPISANHDKWKTAADIIDKQIAALTAAAEVGRTGQEASDRATSALDFLVKPAAAEEDEISLPPDTGQLTVKYTDKDLFDCERATIERCAQVVNELRKHYRSGLGCDPAIDAGLELATAAIRALKEET